MNHIRPAQYKFGGYYPEEEIDKRQCRLTSIDYLLVVLTRFNLCTEDLAYGVWRRSRRKIYQR